MHKVLTLLLRVAITVFVVGVILTGLGKETVLAAWLMIISATYIITDDAAFYVNNAINYLKSKVYSDFGDCRNKFNRLNEHIEERITRTNTRITKLEDDAVGLRNHATHADQYYGELAKTVKDQSIVINELTKRYCAVYKLVTTKSNQDNPRPKADDNNDKV